MEIIKEGELPGSKTYTATCNSCKTVFRFRAGEAKYITDQRDGDYYSVTCPLKGCHSTVTANARNNEIWIHESERTL